MAAKKNLTVRFVETVKPPTTAVEKHWDQAIPAFGLFVYPTGLKTWNVFYRVNGQQKTKMLGRWPTIDLKAARDRAQDILRAASRGEDLVASEQTAPSGDTFQWLASEYLEHHAKPNKRQWKTDERLIEKELLPSWGKSYPADIGQKDVVTVLDRLVKRNAPIQANRVHSLISKIFNWAISRDLLDYNPCQQVKKQAKERQRERVLAPNEVKNLWGAFNTQKPHVSAIMKLMLLTAQRKWEVSHMRWRDIDLDTSWWTIPGDFSKNGRSHRVPLTKAVLDIIEGLPRQQTGNSKETDGKADTDWVFPSPTRKGQFINNVQKAKRRVDQAAGVDNFVLHDLRRTAASYMAQEGVPGNIISKLLNHTEAGVTQVYNRYSYDKEKREALESWESKLLGFLGPSGFSIRKLGKAGRARRRSNTRPHSRP